MKDQELHDIFHGYRPELSDEDAFMDKLTAQMDAIDAKQQAEASETKQRLRIMPLYRRVLPWGMGIAAAIAVAAVVIFPFLDLPMSEEAISYEDSSELPANHFAPSLIGKVGGESGSSSSFSDSYEEIVNEIEQSGRLLENAIAQL